MTLNIFSRAFGSFIRKADYETKFLRQTQSQVYVEIDKFAWDQGPSKVQEKRRERGRESGSRGGKDNDYICS